VLWWFLNHAEVNGIFNIGTGQARSWNDLANSVFAALGRAPQIEYIEMPDRLKGNYQYHTQATIEKLRNAGCEVPFRSLEDAVADYVQTHLATPQPYLSF
jgi:ADP-L-glycero-D-manno-heptose 6-epimerase